MGKSSEPEESSDLGELQMAVFKTSWKSEGTLVEPAGGIPEPTHGGHIPPCPCLLKTPEDWTTWKTRPHTAQEPTSEVASICEIPKSGAAAIQLICMEVQHEHGDNEVQ